MIAPVLAIQLLVTGSLGSHAGTAGTAGFPQALRVWEAFFFATFIEIVDYLQVVR